MYDFERIYREQIGALLSSAKRDRTRFTALFAIGSVVSVVVFVVSVALAAWPAACTGGVSAVIWIGCGFTSWNRATEQIRGLEADLR